MNYFKEIVSWQPFWTVITGVLVFSISQFIMEVYVKPYQEYKSMKKRISYNLTMYANRYTNLPVFEETDAKTKIELDAISTETRGLAAELIAYIEILPRLMFFVIPQKRKIKEAADCLIGLSNSLYSVRKDSDEGMKQNKDSIDRIKVLLKIYEE